MKKITFILKTIICIFFIYICMANNTYASTKKEGIENFPESYKPYLIEL